MKTATTFSSWLLLFGSLTCTKPSSDLSSQIFANNQEIFQALGEHSQVPASPQDPEVEIWVQLGKTLFHDPNWSRSKKSCAQCHGESGQELIASTEPRLPSPSLTLRNSSYLYQFGQVGQYASILDVTAHMILNSDYINADLEALQNTISPSLADPRLTAIFQGFNGQLSIQQKPLSARLIAKAYASLKNKELKTAFNKMLTSNNLLTEETMQAILNPSFSTDPEAKGMPINEIHSLSIAMASYALSTYVLSLTSYQSPFDKFAAKALQTLDISSGYQAGFAKDEWQGFLVFRKHSCHLCHSGPNFSRGLTYNVGGNIPVEKGIENPDTKPLKLLLYVMGHAASPLYPQYIDFSCNLELWKNLAKTLLQHSCDALTYPANEIEAIGSYKTPSLRNLKTIEAKRYHKKSEVLVGALSPLLNPEELDRKEEEWLGKFLESLKSESPIR